MRKIFFLIPSLFFLMGFNFWGCPFPDGDDPDPPSGDEGVVHRERDTSGKLAIGLGGLAEHLDEIILDESFTVLEFENNDPDLLEVQPRRGFNSFIDGKGALILPQEEGIGYVTPIVNGQSRNPIEVTIPPQKLVQILLGEARGELDREATLNEEEQVKATSVSVTGDAVASVIRNRIALINTQGSPELFLADPTYYESNPPFSYYEAVIEANNGTIYQFSPVAPSDPSHEVYLQAEQRTSLDTNLQIAYDQAVLTASAIFNEDTQDPTGGAFGFYSPTEAQYERLEEALQDGLSDLPAGCGTSDANFPAFAPVQVLILEDIALSATSGATSGTTASNIPSFVFVRQKGLFEPAVTDQL